MAANVQLQIIRKSELLDILGIKKSKLYKDIQLGVFPKPISLGARSVGWLYHEAQEVIAARSRGLTEEQLKEVIVKLHDMRSELAKF